MAAGDFLIYSNTANSTDILPITALGAIDLTWDTLVKDDGSAASYSAGTFTLTNTAPYLIIYSERWYTTDTTNNERIEGQGRIRLNGVNQVEGACEGYIRKSSDDQDMIINGTAIVYATAGDTFTANFYRGDNSVAGTVTRVPNNGGVQIIQLDAADDFAKYTTSGTNTMSSTEASITAWTTNLQEAGFSRSSGAVTISDAGRYLMVLSGTTSETGTSRLGATIFLENGTTEVTGIRGYSHMRGSDSNQNGAMSFAGIVNVGVNDVFTLRTDADNGAMTLDAGAVWQWWKLPAGNATAIMEATTGDMNSLADFTWDTAAYVDTGSFTAANSSATISPDQGTHLLSFWNQGKTLIDSVQRASPMGQPSLNGVPITYAASSSYHRNSGSIGKFMAHGASSLVLQAAAGSSVTLLNSGLAAAGVVDVESGHFSVLKLEGLYKNYSYEFPVLVVSVDGDDVVSNAQTNVVIIGDQFGAAQLTGKVEIGPNFDYSGTKILQSIDSWTGTSIQFDVTSGAQADSNAYLFVTSDAGLRGVIPLQIGLPPETYTEAISNMAEIPDHHWTFQNTYNDEVGPATASTFQGGTPTFSSSITIVKGDSHTLQIDSELDYTGPADQADMNTYAATRRYIGGWFMLDRISQTLSVIYEEGAQVNNMALLNGFGNNAMFQIANANDDYVQVYLDVSLTPNRPYHFLANFVAGGVCGGFLDGVPSSRTDGNPWETGQLDTHSGNISWGHEGTEELKVGDDRGVDATTIAFVSPVRCNYAHWYSWSEIALDPVADIRKILFEKGAPAEYTIVADTEVAMQASMDALASTLYLDWPCSIEIGVCTDGDFTLTLDNITFEDRVSMQIRYVGINTLTLVATNGTLLDTSKLGAPYGGVIAVQTPANFEIQGIINGAEIRIYDDEVADPSNFDTELAGTEANVGTTFQYSHSGTSNDVIIQMIAGGYEEVRLPFTLNSADQILVLSPKAETNI